MLQVFVNVPKGRWSRDPGSPVRKDCGCWVGVGSECWCAPSAVLGAVAEPAAPHMSSGSSTRSQSHLHPNLGFLPVPPEFVPQFCQDQMGTPRPRPLPWALPDPSWPYEHHSFLSFCCIYCIHFKVLNKNSKQWISQHSGKKIFSIRVYYWDFFFEK